MSLIEQWVKRSINIVAKEIYNPLKTDMLNMKSTCWIYLLDLNLEFKILLLILY